MSSVVAVACFLLGLALGVNGAVMLWAPGAWYFAVPGVLDTGALNTHFVRDIGATYALAGLALLTPLLRPAAASLPVAAAALWLSAHALIHLAELTVCGDPAFALLRDVPGVYLPALLATTAALFLSRGRSL